MTQRDDGGTTIDRRRFLELSLGLGSAAIAGCSDESTAHSGDATGTSTGTSGDASTSTTTSSAGGSSSSGADATTTGTLADSSSDGGSEDSGTTGSVEACEPEVEIVELDPDAIAQDDEVFPLALMAGEMRQDAFMVAIWIPDAQPKVLVVWLPGETPGTIAVAHQDTVVPDADGFVKVMVEGLCPGTWYRYACFVETDGAFTARTAIAEVRTAIADDVLEPLVVAMSACNGDADGAYSWPALDVMADEYFDVFLHLGDMAYNDGLFSREEYRENWRRYLGSAGFKRILAGAGMYGTWDDHEIDDNSGFDPRSMTPEDLERRTNALSSYFEALPIDGGAPDFRLWRSFRWGLTAEIIVLDCRYERRASQGLYMSPDQLAFLQERLLNSPCHFKVVMNSVPITNMPLVWDLAAFDRWEGFPEQRNALLQFIDANQIENVWWLSGDFHVCFVSRLEPAGNGFAARSREIACTGGNTNILGDLLGGGQFAYGTSQPRGVILMFDPAANAVNVRYIDPATGEDDFNQSLVF